MNISRIATSFSFALLFLTATIFTNCDKTPEPTPSEGNPLDTTQFTGTGSFTYEPTTGAFAGVDIPVYFHIPQDAHSKSPILFLFHGNSRDAEPSRNALLSAANSHGVILLAPEFSKSDFPTNAYHLGNVFENGEDAATSTLHPKEDWTYAIIETLFDYFTASVGSDQQVFDAFGHSAGGQFAHRLALFSPAMRYRKLAAAASGWYTFTDTTVAFPYGLQHTPVHTNDLKDVFSRDVYIVVGQLDTDPNASALRNTPEAVLQGDHRLERAQNFFNAASITATGLNTFFHWEYNTVPNTAHSFQGNGTFIMNKFYNP